MTLLDAASSQTFSEARPFLRQGGRPVAPTSFVNQDLKAGHQILLE